MDINQPFVTQEQKFKYWEESKAEIKHLRAKVASAEVFNLEQILHDPENKPSQYGTVPLEWYENLENEINSLKERVEELQADNNKLREALEIARKEYEGLPHSLGYEFTHLPIINKALSSTHENKIE